MAFLAQMIEEISQVTFRPTGDNIPGCLFFSRIEPHVQWPFSLETQAPLSGFDLIRRKAKVSEHAIDPVDLEFIQHQSQSIKIGMNQSEAGRVTHLLQPNPRSFQR